MSVVVGGIEMVTGAGFFLLSGVGVVFCIASLWALRGIDAVK